MNASLVRQYQQATWDETFHRDEANRYAAIRGQALAKMHTGCRQRSCMRCPTSRQNLRGRLLEEIQEICTVGLDKLRGICILRVCKTASPA